MRSMEEMMKRKLEDVEPPKNLPVGNYVFKFHSYKKSVSKSEEWEFLRVAAKPVEACEDVDPDELEEYGPIGSAMCSRTFIAPLAEDADNDRLITLDKMVKFCGHMGLSDDTKTVEQIFAEAKGAQFIGLVEHRLREDDPEAPPNVEISRTAPVE